MSNIYETHEIFAELNGRLEQRYRDGEPIRLHVNARPKLRIMSFLPLIYEEYGILRNRAPHISGSIALRGLITQDIPDANAVTIYAGIQAEEAAYGIRMSNGAHEQSILQGVSELLGVSVSIKPVSDLF